MKIEIDVAHTVVSLILTVLNDDTLACLQKLSVDDKGQRGD